MGRFLAWRSVAISAESRRFADLFCFSTSRPLIRRPSIEIGYVAAEGGVMPGSALTDYDALILLVPRSHFRASRPTVARASWLVSAWGCNVDLDACNEAGIAVVTTPDGIRRPLAVAIITFILALTSKLMVKDRLTRQGPDRLARPASLPHGRGVGGSGSRIRGNRKHRG